MDVWAKVAGVIVLAYFVFTTVKGNLRGWLEVVGLKPDRASPTGPAKVGLRGLQ